MNPPSSSPHAGRKRARASSRERSLRTHDSTDSNDLYAGTAQYSGDTQLSKESGGIPDPYAYASAPQHSPPVVRNAPQASSSSTTTTTTTAQPSTSSFRNVSACNRCRIRKNRCDQNLPACAACEKAGVKCVGFDPITKREIPRSYVFFLETRASYLESLLRQNKVAFIPAETFALDGSNTQTYEVERQGDAGTDDIPVLHRGDTDAQTQTKKRLDEEKHIENLVSDVGLISVHGASEKRFLGSTSGITFARVVFAAVKSTVSRSRHGSEMTVPGGSRRASRVGPAAAAATSGGSTMRDSFFGLHTKPTIKEAPFPEKDLGLKLVNLYFEHANPQIPVLHRGEFMGLFEHAYSSSHRRTPRESYLLNIVFAIGAGIIYGSSDDKDEQKDSQDSAPKSPVHPQKRARISGKQSQPEEYHASAIMHLESFLGSSHTVDRPDGFGGGLEELQAVLLLAGFALLRPVAPGLWYIVGVAVRLGVDLGLHYEDGAAIDGIEKPPFTFEDGDTKIKATEDVARVSDSDVDDRERGRRQWVRDLRRRLWWCVYSFDRLVSTCVGRPFGITDQVVTTEFPSSLDDKYITPEGLNEGEGGKAASYKFVAHHYFRLRLLQSEVQQVLQYQQAQRIRAIRQVTPNPHMHTQLPSPFLQNFDSFREWRADVDRRLWEWKESAPAQTDTGVAFTPLFLDLNYWQAVIMLYRQSLTTPVALATDAASVDEGVSSPMSPHVEEEGDEEFVFLKIAEAGQKVLKIYRQLHRVHLVNYTFLATHHLFMAGISFLYAIWHSVTVRSHLSLDDVDFTVLAAVSVLEDLMDKCPPAEACRDAFNRMSKATIQMAMSTTGFGSRAASALAKSKRSAAKAASTNPSSGPSRLSRLEPKFDMDLRDLFSDADMSARPFGSLNTSSFARPERVAQSEATAREQTQTAEAFVDPSLQRPSATTATTFRNPFSNAPAQQQQGQYSELDGARDMDFLDNYASGAGEMGDALNTGDPGAQFDLFGFGGMDGTHDWSDGNGFDLFEGFFFGNAGGPPSA